MKPGKVRIGVLTDSLAMPAWACGMLEGAAATGNAEIALAVIVGDDEIREAETSLSRRVYRAIADWSNRPMPAALAPRDASSLLAGVPMLRVQPERRQDGDWISDADVEAICGYALDTLVWVGDGRLRGDFGRAAKFGVWVCCHETAPDAGGAVALSSLRILGGDGLPGPVIIESASRLVPRAFDLGRNAWTWKSASFLPRALAQLTALGEQDFFEKLARNSRCATGAAERRQLSSTEPLGRAMGRWLCDAAQTLRERMVGEQWIIAAFLWDAGRAGPRMVPLIPPRGTDWADPCVIQSGGKYHIFFEELVRAERRGHISVVVMDDQGRCQPPVRVLERPYHLSYPFVFEWQGGYYMIPETAQNRAIEVYRCVEFPARWEFHKTLMAGVTAVDSTLFCDGAKWWLFANLREREGASLHDELFLFSADEPLSDRWQPHPLNPVVSDVRRARPAGRIFRRDGHLYRPSQDCSRRYGGALNINRVEALNGNDYRESCVTHIEPASGTRIRGIHTLSQAGPLVAVDLLVPLSRRAGDEDSWRAIGMAMKPD